MLIKVIACEILFRELCHCAARSPSLVDFEFLTQGHHDTPKQGRVEIQRRIDAVPAGKYDAIVLGYGLCSNIVTGLVSTHTRLVIPRAHDCISLFLGSKERYQEHFASHPGTYYYTSGWLECLRRRAGTVPASSRAFVPASQTAPHEAFEELAAKYGEDNARYLMETMADWSAHYSRGAWIGFEFVESLKLQDEVRRICQERGWQYEEVAGDLGLMQRLLDGPWAAEDFLVVEPGSRVAASFGSGILESEPIPPAA